MAEEEALTRNLAIAGFAAGVLTVILILFILR